MLMLPVLLAVLVPVRVTTAPHVDGHLDDALWATIPASGAFTQSFPNDGAAPSEATRVQVAYDDETLYIALDCVQRARDAVTTRTPAGSTQRGARARAHGRQADRSPARGSTVAHRFGSPMGPS